MGGLAGNVLAMIDNEKSCRICLETDETPKNPLICPCKCIGSVRFIHLDCIKAWLDSKKQSQHLHGVSSYYWEELSCELCKTGLLL